MTTPPFQVYIVESPSFDDLYREKTEGRLISQGLSLADIPSTLRLAGNLQLFRNALHPDLAELKNIDSVPPLLHLSTHGSNEGVLLTSGERMTWKELRELLSPLNRRLSGHLVLCMSSCFGYQAIQAAMTKGDLPFCLIIGHKGKPKWSEAAVGYLAFYHALARGADIKEAIEALKKASHNNDFEFAAGQKVKDGFAKSILACLED
jgi:hypothetical protein